MNNENLWGGTERLLLFLMLVCAGFAENARARQTQGTVTFGVTTISFGGKYKPKNVGAIWVENARGDFVKTLKVWAEKRRKHLTNWNAASGRNTVDAVTRATIKSHQSHSVSWNCTDVDGALVADGSYKIFVEFTEDNSSSSGKPPSKVTSVSFAKGPSDQTVAPADEQFFKSVQLVYTAEGGGPQPATLQGSVVDARTNAAISNANILLKSNGAVAHETTSNVAGAFEVTGIAPGTYTLEISADGYISHGESITFASGQSVSDKKITLSPVVTPARLSGTVLESGANTAIPGASVQLKIDALVIHETTTDAGGNYNFDAIQPNSYTLLVFKDGYTSVSEAISFSSGQQITNKKVALVKINNGATLTGKVVRNDTGAAIHQAIVQLKSGSQVRYETSTNASGNFSFAAVAAGDYMLACSKNGFENFTENISLQAGQTVSGKQINLRESAAADTTPPAVPAALSAKTEGRTAILSWRANSEADVLGYRIYFGKAAGNLNTQIDAGNVTRRRIENLKENTTWHFSLAAYDSAGNESALAGPVSVFITATDTAGAAAAESPAYNFPNPFRPASGQTVIRYEMNQAGAVTIEIFNLNNQPVRTIADGAQKTEGEHTEDVWDGRDENGRVVPNGVYYCRISAPGVRRFIRIVVVN